MESLKTSRTDNDLPSDLEKGVISDAGISSPPSVDEVTAYHDEGLIVSKLRRINNKIESLAGLEARGIKRVLPDERHGSSTLGYCQMAFLWFSANISANNLAVGFLGPLLFDLGFVDSAMCAVFGSFLGCVFTAYMSIWGAQSGSRTMVVARFFMGYWPSKICVLLNIVIMVGYGMIDCVIGGQMLSAVSNGSMTIIVGIVVVAFISWIVAVFGMRVFHVYERWAWIPQLLVLFIMIGCAGPKFNTSLQSVGSPSAVSANRLSFFSLSLSVPVSWAAAASDFYVYYPENTSRRLTYLMTLLGLTLSFVLVTLLGVGLASAVATNQGFSDAYAISSGALILAGFGGLGGFGKFCGVIIALGVVANNIPGTYSAALGFQMLGRYPKMIPRWLYACFVVIIYLVCALAGRDHLFVIFQNFLALMGYWIMIMICIVLEEHFWFRRNIGFDWTAWEDQERLPIGIAALIAFLVGWAGAVLSMYQVYFVGPIAKLVSEGADLGIWVGCGFTLITFAALRPLELRIVGR